MTRKQVEEAARTAGVEVRRNRRGWSQWWMKKPGEEWRTFMWTNYTALQELKRITEER